MHSQSFTLGRDADSGEDILTTSMSGALLLDSPMLNKSTAFTQAERDELGLRGLLPPHVSSMAEQVHRVMDNYGRKSTDLERYIHLMSLLDRNETLFYRVLHDNIEALLPIVYTPTVGLACQSFGKIYRRPRGIYLTPNDVPHLDKIFASWPFDDVRVIVVTDGERILGLGDLGANGMGIPIGKLALYVVAAGIHPSQVLPVCLDVGTENEALRADPLYLGTRIPRLRGASYDELVGAFFAAATRRFPKVLIQFEDFGIKNSFRLLDRFREQALCFNDDIQGTGAVALAAILAGLAQTGRSLDEQKVVIVGAGSAGVGIARQIRAASARAEIWIAGSKGVVTPDVATDFQMPFAREDGGELLSLCKRVQPTVLIGVTGQPGLFTQEILGSLGGPAPIVLPLSNPTSSSECTPDEARAATGGRALVATGSPFPGTAQCNNVYVFPGVGLGLRVSGATRVTDAEFTAAARAVASLATDKLLPSLKQVRAVSAAVARAVGAKEPERHMWEPSYVRYRRAP